MNGRAARIEAFLAAHGWADAARTPIAGDASFRRYERLERGAETSVLMDAPPPQENVRPFVSLARHLAELGLSAPRILAADEEAGLLILEDFGRANLARLVDDPATPRPEIELWYGRAVDTLASLHRDARARAAPAPPFGEERYLREVGYLLDWYWPTVMTVPLTRALRANYLEAWRSTIPLARQAPETLVLFDFFPDNIMPLPDREGAAACGLLDFQDAVIGPATYDLVSLVEDARRDLAPEFKASLKARYLDAFPALDRQAFEASYAAMSAQRNTRIVGVFTRLSVRDGKPNYLRHIPRVWSLVDRALAHPALGGLKAWFERHMPQGARHVPRQDNGH
ncbi:MAG TPA: phosphotransferase [Alphaproteobacteria bacterium]|nr:phosphotransferase [Alphaproteobacteria bacterium]